MAPQNHPLKSEIHPVSAEEVSAAPVQKQGVVVQNVLHRDAVKGGELVRKLRCEAAVKCAAFQIPVEPFLHAHHGSDLFLQQVKTIAAPTQTAPWVWDVGVRVGILFSIPKCAGERISIFNAAPGVLSDDKIYNSSRMEISS